MKKTITVNLNSIVFQIDEDAYQALGEYLESVEKHLNEENGQKEIMSDIESRIAELFSERLHRAGQVVTVELVNDIINIMGRPADYGEEADFGDQPKEESSTTYNRTAKRLYRDPEKAIVAGILSGLAIYLNIDVVWLRIIFVVLVFLGVGTIIPIYIVLWLVIPKAETTAQRMEMRGIDVTIENLKAEAGKVKERFQGYVSSENIDKKKEQIKSEANRVKDNVHDYVHSGDFQKGVKEMGTTAEKVGKGFLKILFAFIAGVVGLVGAIVVVGLLIILILSFVEPSWVMMNLPGNVSCISIASASHISLLSGALLVLIGVPVYMLFYAAIKMLSADAHLSSTSIWVSVLLWLAGLFFLISLSTRCAYIEWFNHLL
jgi:phage shock protein PspC (stress-responsive transcriptional regulator)